MLDPHITPPSPTLLPPTLAALHQSLGIPADYASRRQLSVQLEVATGELVTLSAETEREIRLVAPAAIAWSRMQTAARQEGIVLTALSGFRGVARQAEIIRRKLKAGQSIERILSVNAAPGFSEHHTGRALDIGTDEGLPLETSFAETKAFTWLEFQAGSFGFNLSFPLNNPHGISFEPWHWCWMSRPA